MMRGIFFHVPLDVLTTPAEGHCFVNRWWAVHPEKGAAFYAVLHGYLASEEPSPQANSDEAVAKVLCRRLLPDHAVTLLPAAYLRPAMVELKRLRKDPRAAIAAAHKGSEPS